MNHRLTITNGKKSIGTAVVQINKHLVLIGAVTIGITLPAIAQNSEIQQKLAAVKQAAAENKQKIRQYQWIETTQLTLKVMRSLRRRTVAFTAPTVKSKRP